MLKMATGSLIVYAENLHKDILLFLLYHNSVQLPALKLTVWEKDPSSYLEDTSTYIAYSTIIKYYCAKRIIVHSTLVLRRTGFNF